MAPASWLEDHADLLPRSGCAVDVACGRGRHALWLAARGLSVLALDRNEDAIRELHRAAVDARMPILAETRDLETGAPSIGIAAFDVVVVIHYLHRPLFPTLLDALRPGGLLIYETFTRAQALRGKPTNPDFLLDEGELWRLVQPLEIVDYREGLFEDRELASVVARRTETETAE
jgi:SAM-dependent methyltransferase